MNVSIIRPLAEGAYAQVFLVRAAGSGEMLAMKRIICQSQEVENDVQTELRVLQVFYCRLCHCYMKSKCIMYDVVCQTFECDATGRV